MSSTLALPRGNVPTFSIFFFSEPKPANITADVIFLMDSSTSVGRDGFDKEKSFVKSLAKYFNVSPGKSRAAVIAYSTTARTVLTFTAYQSETDFNDKLDKEPWFGGSRRIDRALEAAATLHSQSPERSKVPKIVVLITAGEQTTSVGATPLGVAAQPLKDIGAKTIVITVGSEADPRNLLPVVDSKDDMFGVPLFNDLRYEVQPVVKYTVKHFGKYWYNYFLLGLGHLYAMGRIRPQPGPSKALCLGPR